jgi:hypothetical protein
MQFTRYYLITPNSELAALISEKGGDWEALLCRMMWSNSEGGRTTSTDEEWRNRVVELFLVYMRKFLLPAPVTDALGLHDERRLVEIFARWWNIEGVEEDESTCDVANMLRKREDLTAEEQGIVSAFPDWKRRS